MKATSAHAVKRFEDIPNVGPAMARDFCALGLESPNDLKKSDPLVLYQKLSAIHGVRQDPCVLDTFMAVIDFMNGAPPRPWWHYTKERKFRYTNL